MMQKLNIGGVSQVKKRIKIKDPKLPSSNSSHAFPTDKCRVKTTFKYSKKAKDPPNASIGLEMALFSLLSLLSLLPLPMEVLMTTFTTFKADRIHICCAHVIKV